MRSFSFSHNIEFRKAGPVVIVLVLGLGLGILASRAMPGTANIVGARATQVPIQCASKDKCNDDNVSELKDQIINLQNEVRRIRGSRSTNLWSGDFFDPWWSLLNDGPDWPLPGSLSTYDSSPIRAMRLTAKDCGKNIEIAADVPGVDEKDLDVSLSSDTVTIKAIVTQESARNGTETHSLHRSSSAFVRTLSLPAKVQSDKAQAVLNKGVLTITIPKSEQSGEAHKLSIKTP